MEAPAAPMPGWKLVKRGDTLMSGASTPRPWRSTSRRWTRGTRTPDTAYSAACAAALLGRKREAMS